MNSMIDWIREVYNTEDIEILEHSSDDYSYLEEGEKVLIFKNPFNEECNLYVFFLKKRYTLIFGNWSCHFAKNLKDEKALIYSLELILNKQAHVLSVYNDCFIFSCLCYKHRLFFSTDASNRLVTALANREFLQCAAQGDITVSKIFWEQPSQILEL